MRETSEQRIRRVMAEQAVDQANKRIAEAKRVRAQILEDRRTGAKRDISPATEQKG